MCMLCTKIVLQQSRDYGLQRKVKQTRARMGFSDTDSDCTWEEGINSNALVWDEHGNISQKCGQNISIVASVKQIPTS